MASAVPFLDLRCDYEQVREEVAARFQSVLESQCFVLGVQTAELEARMQELTGAQHAVACSSGSDALVLALLAGGWGPGDAIVVPALTFIATASAVCRVGARPVFADVDAATYNLGQRELAAALDREFERSAAGLVHRRGGQRLRAVIPVDLFGRAANTLGLAAVAKEAGAAVIEDAAQAIGAVGEDGPVGSRAAAACFSFYPTKNIGGAGDGGVVTTNDAGCAARVRRLRTHGANLGDAVHRECGLNARMGELQAAYVNAKLDRLLAWMTARAAIAQQYLERLEPLARSQRLVLPASAMASEHVWHQFVVRVEQRDRVRAHMAGRGVETRVFYPIPLHLQPCFSQLGYRAGDLPEAERLAREVLSLPIYPSLEFEAVDLTCEALAAAVGG